MHMIGERSEASIMNEPVMHQSASGTKEWRLHGKLHREDGAAIEWFDGTKSWYLHGMWYSTPEAWAEALLQQRNEPCDTSSVDAFLKPILKKGAEQAL